MKKKTILLALLIAVLASCGGGGGGGGAAPQSGGPSPIIPSPGTNPGGNSGSGGNGGNNGSGIIGNGQNPGSGINPQNPSNPGSGLMPQNPNVPDQFPKPTDNRQTTGTGVKLGVLDDDFVSGDAFTQRFYKDPFLLVGTRFDEVLRQEFGNRFEALAKDQGIPGRDDHGLMVATIMAGKSGKGATGSTVYGASFGESNGSVIIDTNKYIELRNKGVKIYNQSFGTPNEFNMPGINYRNEIWNSLKTAGVWTQDQIDHKTDELINFYKDSVNDGALFVWAAGNRKKVGNNVVTLNNPTIQAGLQEYIPSLYKGWIAVVGVRDDGTEFGPHLARAGAARMWTISANGYCELSGCSEYGSSFAAPRVTAAAAKVKEKFPWMTGHELKQTLLTTAKDLGDPGVDGIFGWGLLDEQKALKGPAQFNSELLVGKSGVNAGLKGQFNANITNNLTSIFENDIDGEGGLKKSGNGKLILTGNNSYQGSTDIEEGTLEIYGDNGSNITIKNQGTLITYPKTMIGLKNYNGNVIPKNVENNGGTLENKGSGAVITGNYTATNGSVTKAEIGTKLTVKGAVNLNGGNTLRQTMSGYITAKPLSSTVIEAEKGINGTFDKVETPELINGSATVEGNKVVSTVSRKNVEDYVSTLSLSDTMRNNTAQNLETSFKELDSQIENGNTENVKSFSRSAALIQKMSLPNAAAVLDSLSGQIYASAQALTFQHSQTVNKDLSNRLVMLGTLDNVGDNAGLWVTGIGANGRLRQEGFGVGKTHTYGGQVGIDKAFGNSLILGTALSYSKSDVKFDRYGGESKGDGFGISLYGRLGNKEVPYYLQGRIGIGFITSNVERDILLGSGDITRAKIEHRDKVYSGYLESGYDAKIGSLTITPYVGLSHDTVERGAFSEENSQFGLTADKKRYNQTSALLGLRLGKSVNWANGSKTTFQGYVTQYIGFKKQDLSFEAAYSGLSNARFKVEGIGLSKNSTWAGIGVLTEVNPKFSWYVNYDAKMEKNKLNNNVFTAGFRFNF